MSDRYDARTGAQPDPGPTRPGPVPGAAVLAFVQAGLLLALVVVVTVAALAGRSPGGVGVAVLVCLAACSLAGLDLLGGLLLLRGGGRTVLLVTALVEAALAGLLLLVAFVDVAVRRSSDPLADLLGVLVLLALLALPVVRLVLAARPAAADVVAARRPPVPPPPVWSPQAGWVGSAAPAPAVPTGLLTAALAPVAVLAVVATVTLALSGESAPIADGPAAGHHGTGVPTEPPVPGDRDHDPRYAGLAAGCRDGDMAACDDLYWDTPVGDPYETYGSTCGGRLDDGTSGGCVTVFGPTD